MKRRSRRGVTMAELCVSMAVISIVTTMVVSFSVLVGERSKSSTAKNETFANIVMVENMVENWIDANKNENIEIASSNKLIANDDKSLEFNSHNELSVNTSGSIPLEHITSVTFDYHESGVYYCTIEYSIYGTDTRDTYTFCVYPD